MRVLRKTIEYDFSSTDEYSRFKEYLGENDFEFHGAPDPSVRGEMIVDYFVNGRELTEATDNPAFFCGTLLSQRLIVFEGTRLEGAVKEFMEKE